MIFDLLSSQNYPPQFAHTGIVTGVGAGTTLITVIATDKTSLETNCSFTVTA